MMADPASSGAPADRAPSPASAVTVVIPNWNGRRWLPGCLESLARQEQPPARVIVVDNGSSDDSLAYLRETHPAVDVLPLATNTGFAGAANAGLRAARTPFVALINTDVELDPDWVGRMANALARDPAAASVACKMLDLADPTRVYDAGDILRRDGACEQRGRFRPDRPEFGYPSEIFGACAGAALYRREAVLALGGFDEHYFAYLEDVDLALRLRLAGWSCRYEPAVARHAGEGSSGQLPGGHFLLVERNTLFLVAKAFPARWLPQVLYRQLGWAWHAARARRLGWHLRGALAVLPMLPGALRARHRLRAEAKVSIGRAVPARPIRGPSAGGHPDSPD